MICPHHSPHNKEPNVRSSNINTDPANESSNKENVVNKNIIIKPSTDNSIVIKKGDAATLASNQTNTTASSSKDNSKTEGANSDNDSSIASSVDSEIFRTQVTTCSITQDSFRKELSAAMKVITLRGDSRDGKPSQQPRRRRALGDISNQKASSQSKKISSKKGRAPRRTVLPLK